MRGAVRSRVFFLPTALTWGSSHWAPTQSCSELKQTHVKGTVKHSMPRTSWAVQNLCLEKVSTQQLLLGVGGVGEKGEDEAPLFPLYTSLLQTRATVTT